jgi:hypothetical protein
MQNTLSPFTSLERFNFMKEHFMLQLQKNLIALAIAFALLVSVCPKAALAKYADKSGDLPGGSGISSAVLVIVGVAAVAAIIASSHHHEKRSQSNSQRETDNLSFQVYHPFFEGSGAYQIGLRNFGFTSLHYEKPLSVSAGGKSLRRRGNAFNSCQLRSAPLFSLPGSIPSLS